jgi:ABC-type Fe3+-hydroxamate transport system substrate-binding protein
VRASRTSSSGPRSRRAGDPLTGLAGRAGWRELDAVRNGRVHGIDPYFYNRPGATVGQAARGLAERIHAPWSRATGRRAAA